MTRLTTTTDCIETYDDGPTTASLDRRQNAAPSRDLLERLQRDFQKLSTRLANYELASTSNAPTWKEQDLDKLKYQNQVVLEWKKAVDFRLDALKQAVAVLEKCKSEGEYQWMSCQQKLMVAEQLQMDINLARDTFLKEQKLQQTGQPRVCQEPGRVQRALRARERQSWGVVERAETRRRRDPEGRRPAETVDGRAQDQERQRGF
jgi:hypothetical protein